MEQVFDTRPFSLRRRWWLLLLAVGSVLTIAFYTVSDPARLSQDQVLGVADRAGYVVCHRLTGHSFLFAGRQMPLCARCTGMYLGVFLVFAVLGLAGRWRRAGLPSTPQLLVLGGFVALMGVDGLNSYSHFIPDAPHLYEPRNWLRLVTGMGTGLAMGLVTFPALAQSLWRDQDYRAPVTTTRHFVGLFLLAMVTVFLVLSNRSAILYVLALVSAAGVVLIMTALHAVILLVSTRRDALARNWRQAALPLLLCLGIVLVEIAIVSTLRFSLTGTMTGIPGL